MTQPDARIACNNWTPGGVLAQPDTSAENMYLSVLSNKPSWIGVQLSFTAAYSNGTAIGFSGFPSNQPAGCTLHNADSSWSSAPCNTRNVVLCQRVLPRSLSLLDASALGLSVCLTDISFPLVPSLVAIIC